MNNLVRLRKMCQRQGAQSLRNEAYFCVGCNDEGCSATQHMVISRSRQN